MTLARDYQSIARAAQRTIQIAGGTALGSIAAVNAWSVAGVRHHVTLPAAIDADRRTFESTDAGVLSYYADTRGDGRPVLLLHSLNAGASAYEMRPLFERLRGERPVYALDMPGFGFSDRAARRYSPAMYTVAVLDMLRTIGAGHSDGADVVALSLAAEFAARAAVQRPAQVHSLVLISPTGFTAGKARTRSDDGAFSAAAQRRYDLLACPLWAQASFDLLATRVSLRAFLRRSFVGKPDPGLVDYAYASTHQPGARHAPLYFVSGKLFTPHVRQLIYERVPQPVLVLYDEDGYVRFDTLDETVARQPNWHSVRIFPSRGLPQFERPDQTLRAIERFWSAGEHDDRAQSTGREHATARS